MGPFGRTNGTTEAPQRIATRPGIRSVQIAANVERGHRDRVVRGPWRQQRPCLHRVPAEGQAVHPADPAGDRSRALGLDRRLPARRPPARLRRARRGQDPLQGGVRTVLPPRRDDRVGTDVLRPAAHRGDRQRPRVCRLGRAIADRGWRSGEGFYQAAVKPAGAGRFRPAQLLEHRPASENVGGLDLVVDDANRGTVAWGATTVRAATTDASATFGAAQEIAPGTEVGLGSAPDGRRLVAWTSGPEGGQLSAALAAPTLPFGPRRSSPRRGPTPRPRSRPRSISPPASGGSSGSALPRTGRQPAFLKGTVPFLRHLSVKGQSLISDSCREEGDCPLLTTQRRRPPDGPRRPARRGCRRAPARGPRRRASPRG